LIRWASASAAVNEYSRAKQTNDNTGSAQDAADRYLKKPYSDSAQPADPGGAETVHGAEAGRAACRRSDRNSKSLIRENRQTKN